MAKRSSEQVIDEIMYAIQCAVYHYGPELSEEGMTELRKALTKQIGGRTDATFALREEDERFIDFHERIIWPAGWTKIEISKSKI